MTVDHHFLFIPENLKSNDSFKNLIPTGEKYNFWFFLHIFRLLFRIFTFLHNITYAYTVYE